MKLNYLPVVLILPLLVSGCAARHTNQPTSTTAAKSEDCPMPQAQEPLAQYEQLKKLQGDWIGTHKDQSGKIETVPLSYHVTSGGTAVEERMMPGTPHEMVTIYYQDGPSVALTHYCMLGNQPNMKLKASDAKSLTFDYVSGTNISSATTPHMHALKMKFPDERHLTQEWTFYQNGAPEKTEVFTFARK